MKDSYRFPSRKEMVKELVTFLRDQAARNAVSSKCLEDIWGLADKPSTGGNWTFMKWPDMMEEEVPIPRVPTGKINIVVGVVGGGGVGTFSQTKVFCKMQYVRSENVKDIEVL